MQGLLTAGWQVTLGCTAAVNRFTQEVAEMSAGGDQVVGGVSVQQIALNDDRFDAWITALNPQVVIFDRFMVEEQFGWRVRASCPEALTVLDTQDLHFLRAARQRASQGEARSLQAVRAQVLEDLGRGAWSEAVIRELSAIHRCDGALVISDVERALLQDHLQVAGGKRLLLVRFHYERPSGAVGPLWGGSGGSERQHFLMVGNFRHPPNLDGFFWLQREIWPRIRAQISDAQVHIYGAYPPKEVMKAHDASQGFFVHGPKEDLTSQWQNSRVNLAPLRFGAGIKGKIADGWAHGLPAVATPLAAEGMHEALPFGGVVVWEQEGAAASADSARAFAASAVRLYQNDCEWQAAGRACSHLMEQLYDQERFRPVWQAWVQQALAQKEQWRRENRMGQLLNYHRNESKRYLSRWIMLKNLQQASSVDLSADLSETAQKGEPKIPSAAGEGEGQACG